MCVYTHITIAEIKLTVKSDIIAILEHFKIFVI